MQTSSFFWRPELKKIMAIALPIIVAQLVQVGMGVIDTVMAGRIGSLALAAIALGAGIWMFAMLVGIGIMLSLPPTISQHIGAENHPLIREELRQGLWLALLVSVFILLITALIAFCMPLLGVEPEIIPEVRRYLLWVGWSLPFSILYMVPRAFNESFSNTMPMLWIWLFLLPLNAFGNYLFMFGNWGFPAMGAAGAGLASGISQTLGFILLAVYTLKAKRYQQYDLARRMTGPDWLHIKQLFLLGLPICISLSMESGMFTVSTLLMGRFGVDIVAGHQIALNIASLTFMVPLGIAQALTVQVGHSIGRKDMLQARKRGLLGVTVCGGFMFCSGLSLWLFGDFFAGLYTPDQQVVAIAAQLMLFAALFQFFDGLQIGASGALRGYKDTKIPMYLTTISYWVVGLPVGVLLGIYYGWGGSGLWLGLVCGLFAAAVLLNGRFDRLSRQSLA
ncbi:MAG: MATE family efflux transporter [Thiolinea sp.]